MSGRGRELIEAGARFADGGGLLARLAAPLFARVLERVDRGLAEGRIVATLPDGRRRVLGDRRPGSCAIVHLNSWMALVRLARSGSVGWYVAWERGEWRSPDPVPLFDLFMRNRGPLGMTARARGLPRLLNRLRHGARGNDRAGSRRNIAAHYDLGNDFYAAWLDRGMNYSSALWAKGDDLEAAQARKVDALLDRVGLAPGERLLDIGCGWGSVLAAATARGWQATGLTLSAEQQNWAEARLGDDADVRLLDYRDADGRYDGIVSIEMLEAVGERHWGDWLAAVGRLLRPGGRAALQFIVIADDIWPRYRESVDFIQTYIFPGGELLSLSRFRALAEQRGFAWRDERHCGLDYACTLAEWRRRFDAAALPAGFDARFRRLWRYYLMYCEGGFRGGGIDVVQVTLEKGEE